MFAQGETACDNADITHEAPEATMAVYEAPRHVGRAGGISSVGGLQRADVLRVGAAIADGRRAAG